jgi:predicted esterase
VGTGSNWQWQQQRMMANSGKEHGFAVLMPRGRLGIGPGHAPNVWAWPGSPSMQKEHEAQVLGEWMTYKASLEQREGPFTKVFVFGFSNGAYYATSLAVRGRLEVDGYGVFAGGSGSRYNRILARQAPHRAPVFVGYGTKDPDHHRQQALIRLLSDLHWRHHSLSARVGHLVTETQLASAMRFLRSPWAVN